MLILLLGCSNNKQGDGITIDLLNTVPVIPYSQFVDSVSYLTLELGEDALMSGVNGLYFDEDYLLVRDRMGIFTFSLSKDSLVKNINYRGEGPEEFGAIRSFTLDTHKKHVIIYSYPFLKKYTYDGFFVESVQCIENNTADLYHTDSGKYICILPEEADPEQKQPCGVWLVDSTFQYIKHLREIPAEQKLFTRGSFYNRTEEGIYYYDRVFDDFSFITEDSVTLLYQFNIKQRVPVDMRTREYSGKELSDYAIIKDFSISSHYILLNYSFFDSSGDLTWVLFDRDNEQVVCSDKLENDLSDEIGFHRLFYVDDHTWCRIKDQEENGSYLKLEFLHIKNTSADI